MQKSEQINELAQALAKAQSQIGPVAKDATNPHLGNRYTTLDAIIEAIKAPLAMNGLAYSQLLDELDGDPALTTILMHESGQWLQSTVRIGKVEGNRAVNEMQTFGIAITYTKRYALTSLLGISSDEDADGGGANRKPARQTTAPSRQSPAQGADGNTFRATSVFVNETKKGKIYLNFTDGGEMRASWWEGREAAAHKLGLTAEQLSEVGARYDVDVLVEWEQSGQYKNAVALHDAAASGNAHWVCDADSVSKFWAWAVGTKGLTRDDVLEALGAEDIADYTGTKKAAMEAIEDWLVERLKA